MGRGRDADPGRPVEPGEARAHGNDPDAVEIHDGGTQEAGSEGSAPRRVGDARGERETTGADGSAGYGDADGGAGAASTAVAGAGSGDSGYGFYEDAPTKNLPPMPFRDMPEPAPLGKLLGPSVVLAGLGVGSGEFIIWPFIVTNVGLGMLWAAVVGVTLQFFLNMEIERYTLATGETAVSGFARFWKPWAIVLPIMAVIPFLFPGWATGGVTMLSFATGFSEGAIPYISIAVLIAIGLALTLSPVVYNTIEKAEFFKVGLTVLFLLIAIAAVLIPRPGDVAALGQAVTNFGRIQTSEVVSIATILSGLVFAGAGGALNLVQSNYIRDKGFGLGAYVPRIVSPITGEPQAEPATGSMMRQDEANLDRWNKWWRAANIEQLVTFWLLCLLSIFTFSLIAYSTVFGKGIAEAADFTFIQEEGQAFGNLVGDWFGTFFFLFGAISLLLVALAIIDNVCRLVADALKTVYLTNSAISESRIYFIAVWSMLALGAVILLLGLDQPLILLVLSACLNGIVMVFWSAMLLVLNRRALPDAIKVKGVRLAILAFCVLFYGFFAGWLVVAQIQGLLAA